MLEHYFALGKGDKCPKCGLGNGLRESFPLELGFTGWENYDFLHCDTCGASYVGKGEDWGYLKHQIFKVNE